MSAQSGIEWCDSTCNAIAGCDGCELWDPKNGVFHCTAGVQITRLLSKGPKKYLPPSFDQPTLFPERIAQYAKMRDLTGTDRPGKPWLNWTRRSRSS